MCIIFISSIPSVFSTSPQVLDAILYPLLALVDSSSSVSRANVFEPLVYLLTQPMRRYVRLNAPRVPKRIATVACSVRVSAGVLITHTRRATFSSEKLQKSAFLVEELPLIRSRLPCIFAAAQRFQKSVVACLSVFEVHSNHFSLPCASSVIHVSHEFTSFP